MGTLPWELESPRCNTCRCRETYCRYAWDIHGNGCCKECSHSLPDHPHEAPTLRWVGDDA